MSIGLYGILEEAFDRTLTEAQQVVIDFKGIFGADTYEAFKDVKRRLGSPENDISYWVRRYREEGEPVIGEMSRLVGGETSLTKRDVEGRRIPEPEETKELVASNDYYDVYNVTDVGDMIDLAMRKVDGHAGAYWCIAGRYNLHGYDVDRDDAVKVSQAEEYFERYLDGDYFAYFVCMPKDGDHQKYCICATGPSSADVWGSDDRREADSDARDIPAFESAGLSYEGVDNLDYDSDDEPDDDEEPEDEGPHQWQDEDGLLHMGERPADPIDPEMISVEDPNAMEFRAGSKEEAIAAFADSGVVDGVEFVEDIPNTPVCIIKFMVEPEHEEFPQEGDDVYIRDLPGDRYTAFIFFPGEGGGPLLTQDGKIIANRTIDGAKRPFVREFDQGNVFHQGQEPVRPEPEEEPGEENESLKKAENVSYEACPLSDTRYTNSYSGFWRTRLPKSAIKVDRATYEKELTARFHNKEAIACAREFFDENPRKQTCIVREFDQGNGERERVTESRRGTEGAELEIEGTPDEELQRLAFLADNGELGRRDDASATTLLLDTTRLHYITVHPVTGILYEIEYNRGWNFANDNAFAGFPVVLITNDAYANGALDIGIELSPSDPRMPTATQLQRISSVFRKVLDKNSDVGLYVKVATDGDDIDETISSPSVHDIKNAAGYVLRKYEANPDGWFSYND